MRLTPTEAQVKRAITDYLDACHICWFRMQSGKVKCQGGGWMTLNREGTPDLLLLIPVNGSSRPVWVEVKAGKGKRSEAQELFAVEAALRKEGYVLAYSVDDVREFVEARGGQTDSG